MASARFCYLDSYYTIGCYLELLAVSFFALDVTFLLCSVRETEKETQIF